MYGKLFVSIDTETADEFTDLPTRKHLTELGAVKYVYTKTGFKPVDVWSAIINEGVGVHPDAVEYTGITPKLVEDFGMQLKPAMESFDSFISDADYIVSHNGDSFDIPILKAIYEELGMEYPSIVNIDTMTCVSYPKNCRAKNLTYLQAFYGFVNPFPHRAFTDAMTTMNILGHFNIEEVAAVAVSPTVKYMASFNYPSERNSPNKAAFAEAMKDFNKKKDEVKNAGFRWYPDQKKWIYEGKELIFNRDIKPNLPCPVYPITE